MRSTKRLILVMCGIGVAALTFAGFYYRSVNGAIDPRVLPARELYSGYNALIGMNRFEDVLALLDEVEAIYSGIPHYSQSYEVGVLYNNRAATYLTLALYGDSLGTDQVPRQLMNISRDSIMGLAESSVRRSIDIYEIWLEACSGKSEEEIREWIGEGFLNSLQSWSLKEQERFVHQREREIRQAEIETRRRLSVSYTNLGVILRDRGEYQPAADAYQQALDLWGNNLSAENNLNILLGRPVRERTMIQKMFPNIE